MKFKSLVASQSLASIVSELNVNRYYGLCSFVILYYDYVLTLPIEIDRYWISTRFSWPTFFFFINRYLSLFGNIPIILKTFANLSPQRCRILQTYHQLFSIIVQLVVGILMVIRIYALYERSRRLLAFLVVVSVVIITIGAWSILRSSGSNPLPPFLSTISGCGSDSLSVAGGMHIAVAWSGLVVFDTILFVLTLYRTFHVRPQGERLLIMVMLRDGTMYYAVLVAANLSNILTLVLADPPIKGISTTFANIISTTLISRMMLNLRAPSTLPRSRFRTTQTTELTDSTYPPTHLVSTIVDLHNAVYMGEDYVYHDDDANYDTTSGTAPSTRFGSMSANSETTPWLSQDIELVERRPQGDA